MPTIHTLGPPYKRSRFTYAGSVKEGVVLEIQGRPQISAEFFTAIMREFKKKTVPGGFSVTIPAPDGFGSWVKENSPDKNNFRLSPRHASFIASILVHEGYITSSFDRNAIILHFPGLHD